MSLKIGRVLFAALALTAVVGAAHAASPFGIATPDGGGAVFGGPLGPLFLWIAQRQQEFYATLTASLKTVKQNGAAVWLLFAVSFAYGVFHAAGPGHGKAVISAYLVSSGESVKRGIVLSFAAAFVQAVTAVLVVGIAAGLFRVTAMTMTAATDWFEILSYALIAAVGAWLLWSKAFGGGQHHHHHHPVADAHHDHNHHEHGHCHDGDHDHDHDGEHDHHAHDHEDHAQRGVFARGWSAILAVGIRPCSGAIIVLVFALSQGLFLAGVGATFVMALGTGLTVAALASLAVSARGLAVRLAGADSSATARVVHAAEIVAAAGVLVFGLLMLGGAVANGLPGVG
jgi:ABC-type nickel/cobalt efflux system permease component RcnA